MRSKAPAKINPRIGLTASVSIDRAEEVDRIARALGISRHKLVTQAFDAGLPIVAKGCHQPDNDPPRAE